MAPSIGSAPSISRACAGAWVTANTLISPNISKEILSIAMISVASEVWVPKARRLADMKWRGYPPQGTANEPNRVRRRDLEEEELIAKDVEPEHTKAVEAGLCQFTHSGDGGVSDLAT